MKYLVTTYPRASAAFTQECLTAYEADWEYELAVSRACLLDIVQLTNDTADISARVVFRATQVLS